MAEMREIEGGVTAARGFAAAGVRCGIKQAGLDLALIFSSSAAVAAGVFTTNAFKAASIIKNQERLKLGAARAIVLSLEEAGVSEIVVVGRRDEAVSKVVALGRPLARAGTVQDARNVDIIINATSVGMAETNGEGRSPIPAELIESRYFVCDLVSYPAMTPLLADARAAGARYSNGIGMLAHQAARAFWIWTGHEPPLDVMLHVVHSRGH